jgi:hypothetical protein
MRKETMNRRNKKEERKEEKEKIRAKKSPLI